jgi:AcrR family transcriptional regulator
MEIVNAAVRVFARDGIARARIADIAAEAGVPLSSLYDYYGTKEDIAYAVPIKHMSEFFMEFEHKARKFKTARDRLQLFLWLTADFARRNKDWARMLYLEVWPSVLVDRARVRMSLDDYGLLVVELIHQGERNGEWQVEARPYETVNIFIGSVNQMIITWLLYRNPKNLMEATESLVKRLLAMLSPVISVTGSTST